MKQPVSVPCEAGSIVQTKSERRELTGTRGNRAPVKFSRGADQTSYTGFTASAAKAVDCTSTARVRSNSGVSAWSGLLLAPEQLVWAPSAAEMMVRTKTVQESDGHPRAQVRLR
jgi:hypothetical protein